MYFYCGSHRKGSRAVGMFETTGLIQHAFTHTPSHLCKSVNLLLILLRGDRNCKLLRGINSVTFISNWLIPVIRLIILLPSSKLGVNDEEGNTQLFERQSDKRGVSKANTNYATQSDNYYVVQVQTSLWWWKWQISFLIC